MDCSTAFKISLHPSHGPSSAAAAEAGLRKAATSDSLLARTSSAVEGSLMAGLLDSPPCSYRPPAASDASTEGSVSPLKGRISALSLTPSTPISMIAREGGPSPLPFSGAVDLAPLHPEPSSELISLIRSFSSIEGEFSLFLGLFFLLISQLSPAEDAHFALHQRFARLMLLSGSEEEKKAIFESFFRDASPILNPILERDGIQPITHELSLELSHLLVKYPLMSIKKLIARKDFSKMAEFQRSPALLHAAERFLILFYLKIFLLHLLSNAKEFMKYHELCGSSLSSFPEIIARSRKSSAYSSWIMQIISKFSEPYPNSLLRNISHTLCGQDSVMDILSIRKRYVNGMITQEETLAALMPHSSLLLDHTDDSLVGFSSMLEKIREGLFCFAAIISFPYVLREKSNHLTTMEVEKAATAFITGKLDSIDLPPLPKEIYLYYQQQKGLLRLGEILALHLRSGCKAGDGLRQIARTLLTPPKSPSPTKRRVLPKPVSGMKTTAAAAATEEEAAPPEIAHPAYYSSLHQFFLSPISFSSLKAFGSAEALQISLSYAQALFKLHELFRFSLSPVEISHYLLDAGRMGSLCLEQIITAKMLEDHKASSRSDLETLIADCGHESKHRIAKTDILSRLNPFQQSTIREILNVYSQLEYGIRALPEVDPRQPDLTLWVALNEGKSDLNLSKIASDVQKRIKDTLMAFFHIAMTIPAVATSIDADLFFTWSAQKSEPLESPFMKAENPLPAPIEDSFIVLAQIIHELEKSSHKKALSFNSFLRHKAQRIGHSISHIAVPELRDFMQGQTKLLLLEILEKALKESSWEAESASAAGPAPAHQLDLYALELDIRDLTAEELGFLRSAKGRRNNARYTEMATSVRVFEPKKPKGFSLACAGAGSEGEALSDEKFYAVKTTRLLDAEKSLAQEMPLMCSTLKKALKKRGWI